MPEGDGAVLREGVDIFFFRFLKHMLLELLVKIV
jgi:hypothetical protein